MFSVLILLILVHQGCLAINCYSDHSGPNSAGGVERCDAESVCSSARIIFREEGILRKAMSRQCVARTPDRLGTEWPWCTEEWAGGDEGGMEVLTCFCNSDFCNDNNFLRGRFSEWTATTMARLKAGPTHVLDIVVSVATTSVVIFFIVLVISHVPWSSVCGGGGGNKSVNVQQQEQHQDDPSDLEEEDDELAEPTDPLEDVAGKEKAE